ncbi:uncharacterized protein LAJ45_09335 [Morchella importuna]|uniref:uncharacterized protein n=1 Tax=Morchella importuna TaxID=1174673 RepID=UPI001E8ED017|nr:uncharacterized protein LAJ45_09335 [Morchella importuna]KAH8146652.1 hypothetical protein LAJ45_09335 [Morchella importuna]
MYLSTISHSTLASCNLPSPAQPVSIPGMFSPSFYPRVRVRLDFSPRDLHTHRQTGEVGKKAGKKEEVGREVLFITAKHRWRWTAWAWAWAISGVQ